MKSFSVVTWNILAPIFVRLPCSPHTAFADIRDDDLDAAIRQKRAVALLRDLNADVLLLQEVQMEATGDVNAPFTVPRWLREGLGDDYLWEVPSGKNQTLQEWARTLKHNTEVLGRPFVTHMACAWRTPKMERLATGSSSHSLSLCFRVDTTTKAVVTNVHLQASPGADSSTRAKQLHSAIKAAEKLAGQSSSSCAFVLGGDCNDSGLKLEEPYQRVLSGPTWTDGSGTELAAVDNFYIRSCRVSKVEERWTHVGSLPSPDIPSDHAPLLIHVEI